ncbi:MAG: hypothetical protein FJY67_11235 [Calditrichaeota bacterium]|nr:hypothetical protein [Calditrichota bacterium]
MFAIQQGRFGVEIETAGVDRVRIAESVAASTGGTITATHHSTYDATIITDDQGRQWKVQNDSSIAIVNGHRGSEVVTPVLVYEDIGRLQEVARALRSAGARVPASTSVHVHVDAQPHSPHSLSNLAKMVHKNEDLLFEALRVRPERRSRYCQPMNDQFIARIAKARPRTDRKLNEYWFGSYNPNPIHYDRSRYAGLNYLNLFRDIHTIEFRYFNFVGAIHAGVLKAWVQLCLALSAKALNSRSASHKKILTDNPRFNFRVWLVSSLGMVGDEFKTARYHLIRYLPGNSAWRYGPPANLLSSQRIAPRG